MRRNWASARLSGLRMAPLERGSLESLVASKEIVVCCGPGGVGKTTVAASIAATAAVRQPANVLVFTVDPARRLADALGVGLEGNAIHEVPKEAFSALGLRPRGRLWAGMLDTKACWDDLISRHSPDRRTADRLLANPLYNNLTSRFAASHDYVAAERVFELHRQGEYDLIVVDTPPSRHALDFIDAPRLMEEFFSSRLARWLLGPQRARLAGLASRPFAFVADRLLGSQLLEQLAEFFLLFQSLYGSLTERVREVSALLADNRSSFVVVTTLEYVPAQESRVLLEALRARKLPLGAIVANKVLPSYLTDPELAGLGERIEKAASELAGKLAAEAGTDLDSGLIERVLREIGQSFGGYQVVAMREAEQFGALARFAPEVVVSAERMPRELTDLEGLIALGNSIWT